MSSPLQGTAYAADKLKRVSYTHDAMIDFILANPEMSQGDIAKHFGYGQAWLSVIFNSDAFQARLAERKEDVIDPIIRASIDEKMKGALSLSYEILTEKLAATRNPDLALKVADLSSKSLGYGARQSNVAIQQNFVVQMPRKVTSAAEWAESYKDGSLSGGQSDRDGEGKSPPPRPTLDAKAVLEAEYVVE